MLPTLPQQEQQIPRASLRRGTCEAGTTGHFQPGRQLWLSFQGFKFPELRGPSTGSQLSYTVLLRYIYRVEEYFHNVNSSAEWSE